MKAIESLQAELTLKMDELTLICRRYGFDATPTILLLHRKGWESSVLMSNAHPEDIAACVAGLSESGNETEMSVSEAAIKQLTGGA